MKGLALWVAACGWGEGGAESREQLGRAQAGGPWLNRLCPCTAGGGQRLSLPAGPSGEAFFELWAWGRRRAWANPASLSSFSDQLESVYSMTREHRTNM